MMAIQDDFLMQMHIQHDRSMTCFLPSLALPLHDSRPSVIPQNGFVGNEVFERVSNINCAVGGDEGDESDEGPDHSERRAAFAEIVCVAVKTSFVVWLLV